MEVSEGDDSWASTYLVAHGVIGFGLLAVVALVWVVSSFGLVAWLVMGGLVLYFAMMVVLGRRERRPEDPHLN